MRITITKGERDDRLDIVRDDGSSASSRFPHKGPIPHDFVHYAVEGELGIERGFWGLVAAGHHPEDIQDIAKEAGHASAKRARVPDDHFIAAVQAERTVEAFEADQWSGASGDPSGVSYIARTGCENSFVPPPPALDDSAVERIRRRIGDFATRWNALAIGDSLDFEWPIRA